MNQSLNLLFLTQFSPSLELGGSKTQLELAEALNSRGWRCRVAGPDTKGIGAPKELFAQPWDVVDWDIHLAVDRSLLQRTTLSVARIPFLHLHLHKGRVPWPLGSWKWRRKAQHILRKIRGDCSEIQSLIDSEITARRALTQADLVNTWNSKDTKLLIEQEGIPPEKLIEIPPGIPDIRLQSLGASLTQHNCDIVVRPPRIVVVATFDYRKGCLDLPKILNRVRSVFPAVKCRLIGTRGLFRKEDEIRRFFPANFHSALEVIPSFNAEDLPRLLADVDIGLFPSYLEGFGIAVIEQLASGLPVFAYDVPGPCDSLPSEWLVQRGNHRALADQIIHFLRQPSSIQRQLHAQAQNRAKLYALNNLADQWDDVYRKHLHGLRS